MKICFINLPIEFYNPVSGGAISTIIYQTAKELILAGHDVTVMTPVDGNPTYQVGSIIQVDARNRSDLNFVQRRCSDLIRYFAKYDWPYFETFLRSVRDRLRKMDPKPDAIILFNDLYLPTHIRAIAPNASLAVWLQNECRTRPATLAKVTAATDVFMTCSQYIATWTATELGIATKKIHVARSGVDAQLFIPRPKYLAESRPPRVLFLGRIDRNKGPDLVIAAVSHLQNEGLDIPLTVAGGVWFYGNSSTDPYYQTVTESLARIGVSPLGHVPRARVPELLREHDIVCVLSRSNEPLGLVAMEAMASGCAVLASNRGGLPEACGNAAILVDPDDFQSVVASLRRLVTDQEFLAQTKRRSVERTDTAGWNQTAQNVLAAIS